MQKHVMATKFFLPEMRPPPGAAAGQAGARGRRGRRGTVKFAAKFSVRAANGGRAPEIVVYYIG